MAIKAKKQFSLKDQLFNAESVAELAAGLKRADADFPAVTWSELVLSRFPDLELKQRIACMVDSLGRFLSDDLAEAGDLLLRALPEPLDPGLSDDDFGRFIWVVPGEYIARHGCNRESLEASLAFFQQSTQRFSAESAIRPFLKQFPEQTLAFLAQCTQHSHYHVRRLASEGTRPFLPWAERVVLPTKQIMPILDSLHTDPTRFVTRSVANNLNDISRIEPDQAVSSLRSWRAASEASSRELDWITRHALRTLGRTDHPGALQLLGYALDPRFHIESRMFSSRVQVGEDLHWAFELESLQRQRLKLGLRIHFLKANGAHSSKDFAIANRELGEGERVSIVKRQAFKPITTRTLYPGSHFAELVVNGRACKRKAFELIA